MSSPDILTLQQKMIAPWPGRPLDDLGLLRVLNENGTKPPLFWTFNSAREPGFLAEALGPDQPFVFTRSSHLLIPPDADLAEPRTKLARYVLDQLERHYPGMSFDVGSSCQGTSLLYHMCQMLAEARIDFRQFCLINCPLFTDFADRPALLIYGSEDAMHDPFTEDAQEAQTMMASMFSSHKRVVIEAAHGTYYMPGQIEQILSYFDAFRRCSSSATSSSTVG